MLPKIEIINGVHPGAVLERELKLRKLKKGRVALEINEYPQTLNAVTKCKRGINPALSIKLGRFFGCDPSYFQILQTYYDISQELRESQTNLEPDLSKIRSGLFWDCDLTSIDWVKNRRAVILRVFERGNRDEIAEIIRFYSRKLISKTLKENSSRLPLTGANATRFHFKLT